MTDLNSRQDIALLVTRFYERVLQDPILNPFFEGRVHLSSHLPKMIDFWESIALGTGAYQGQPFAPHVGLGIRPEHFQRWLAHFEESLSEFKGPRAEMVAQRAHHIASLFEYKLSIHE